MKVREAKPEDLEQIKALAEKHKLNLPPDGTVIIAETSSGVIKAVSVIRGVYFLEPVISESPFAIKELWDYIRVKSIEKNVRILRCFVEPRHVKLLKKIGFYRIFPKHQIYEINFYN